MIEEKAQAEFIYKVYKSYKEQVEIYGAENMKKSSDCLNYAIRGLDKVLGANYASNEVLNKYSKEELKGAKWNKFRGTKYKDKDTHFEHSYPVSAMRKSLILSEFSKEQAVEFILNNYACCFITSEENKRLNALGFNNKRPNGWREAYKKANINFISL
jgi:hypothetical protein